MQAAFRVCPGEFFHHLRRESQPGVDDFGIKARFASAVGFQQGAADEQRLCEHQGERRVSVNIFRHDLTRLHARRGTVEPFGDGAVAEKFQQAFARPWFGEQAAGVDFMPALLSQSFCRALLAQPGFSKKMMVAIFRRPQTGSG